MSKSQDIIKCESDMAETIAEAQKSIARIEGSTSRINKIVRDVSSPVATQQKSDPSSFSLNFITFILVCVITVLGLFGVLFFSLTYQLDQQVSDLSVRLMKAEATLKDFKPPLRSSEK